MQEIFIKIENQIKNNKLLVYMKGTPDNPMCGFSAQVVYILNILNLNYSYIDVLSDNEVRKNLPLYSNWPTFPQIFYKSKLIGGADIITELYKNKKLKSMLTE